MAFKSPFVGKCGCYLGVPWHNEVAVYCSDRLAFPHRCTPQTAKAAVKVKTKLPFTRAKMKLALGSSNPSLRMDPYWSRGCIVAADDDEVHLHGSIFLSDGRIRRMGKYPSSLPSMALYNISPGSLNRALPSSLDSVCLGTVFAASARGRGREGREREGAPAAMFIHIAVCQTKVEATF